MATAAPPSSQSQQAIVLVLALAVALALALVPMVQADTKVLFHKQLHLSNSIRAFWIL